MSAPAGVSDTEFAALEALDQRITDQGALVARRMPFYFSLFSLLLLLYLFIDPFDPQNKKDREKEHLTPGSASSKSLIQSDPADPTPAFLRSGARLI